MPANILKTDFDWDGQDVYIVGSGANAEGACERVPPDTDNIIVVNKAIILAFYGSVAMYWLCATPALSQLEWFREVMSSYADSPAQPPRPFIIARYGTLLEAYPDIPYYFNDGPSLWSDANRDAATNSIRSVTKYFGCTKGLLRGGASAVARGVQLAWFKKAKRCILIGADMKGRVYFDGTVNETKRNTMDNKGYWFELPFFNELIKWVKERDMDVVSLTETALDVEVI